MGNTIYETCEDIRPGAHVFCHDRANGKDGKRYLVINTSWTETTTVEFPKTAEVYALTGNGSMRSRTMRKIYLKGFGICVKESQPKAVMTYYYLLNGTHTAERRDICEDVLRCEYDYKGIIMTESWATAL